MTLYFAYGFNMDTKQMAVRCPGSVALGRARLDGYELTFVWDSPGWGGVHKSMNVKGTKSAPPRT